MVSTKKKLMLFFAVILSLIYACEKILPPAIPENELLDGPLEELTSEELKIFVAGDDGFSRRFTAAEGLGPIFVETSCFSCHIADGRGHPFSELVRFNKIDADGNVDHMEEFGGPQLQHRSVSGTTPEVLPAGYTGLTRLLAPAVTGLGYLEAVPDQTLLDLEDPNDSDGDGISGVANRIEAPSYVDVSNLIPENGKYIGRFGKKASSIDLLMQTVGAYRQDMGITTTFEPDEPEGASITGQQFPDILDFEVENVVFYMRTLKLPEQRNETDPDVEAGKALFSSINCSGCHVPELQTGYSPISGLREKTIYPYTDLLLHDMGPELDDGYTEGTALTSEWRTPALWGLGLAADSQGGDHFLMHDGRAKSIEEAIQMHGGEGENSRTAYNNLSQTEKDQVIAFLESL